MYLMKRALLFLLTLAVSAHVQGAPMVIPLASFESDDLSLVLRVLARQGHFNLVIAGKLSGTVLLRVEKKTPRQIFDMVVASKNLVVNERDGIVYVRTRSTAPSPTRSPK